MLRLPQPVLDTVGTLARLGLAAVWLISGALKFGDPGQAYIAVQAYEVLPDGLIRPVAIGMPLLELALGLFLLAGYLTRWVSVLSVLLLLVLIAAIAQSWARGLTIDCGCFGGGGQISADQTQYPQEIARDLGFALLASWLIVRPKTLLSVDGWLGNSRVPADDQYGEIAEGNE